jgi:glycosyltransferase involved in cell wall biosynthesis
MQSQIYLLTKALAELEVKQEVITIKPPWTKRIENINSVRINRFGLPIPIRRQLYEIPALIQAVHRAKEDFDLVHCHTGEDIAVIPIGLAAAKRAGIPLVLTIHNSWNFTYRATKNTQWIRQTLGKEIEILGFRHANVVCTLTNRTAKLFSEKANVDHKKIFVIPDMVDLARFRSRKSFEDIRDFAKYYCIPKSHNYIVFIGRLVPQKGVIYLLRAIALLREQGEEFVVIICGDGPERHKLEKEAKRLKLSKIVIFTRFVHHDDVPILLSIANIFILPSIFEEFGSTLLEAMAMRLPIVASRIGGIPENIKHKKNGLLVTPMDAKCLADAISAFLHDPSWAHQLGEQAYCDVLKYDNIQVAKRLKSVYTKALR